MLPLNFVKDVRGNVAMIFGLTAVPILIAVGAAVDYSTMIDVNSKMQQALDAVVLSLASEAPELSADELNARAKEIFNANFNEPEVSGKTIDVSFTRTNGANLTATASGDVALAMMGIVGIHSLPVSVTSQSKWSTTRLRVALALDNTGSMNDDGKLIALKTATHNLLDTLKGAASKDGDVYVSIIPFAKDVNVGKANYKKTWLRWDGVGRSCSYVWTWFGWQLQCKDNVALYPSSLYHSQWNGCVADRYESYDIGADAPNADGYHKNTLFPAEQYDSCPSQLTPLTYNWTTLSSAVDSMVAVGGTNQTIGLVWGWQSLMSTEPLNAPAKETGIEYQDIVILLSDGENTHNRIYGSGYEHEPKVDTRMELACTAAKKAGIIIYTVLVIDGNETLLKSCASSEDKYFKVTASDQIVTTFGIIGEQLTRLHLSR